MILKQASMVGCEKPYINGPETVVYLRTDSPIVPRTRWTSWITFSQTPDDVWHVKTVCGSSRNVTLNWKLPSSLISVVASYHALVHGSVMEK